MRTLASIALALASLHAPASAQSAPDPFAVLEAAGRVYRAADAVCADFQQTLSVPLLGQDRTGQGRLCSRLTFYIRPAMPSHKSFTATTATVA